MSWDVKLVATFFSQFLTRFVLLTFVACLIFPVHLVPDHAIVQHFPPKTFSEMRKSMAVSGPMRVFGGANSNQTDVVIGCGLTDAPANIPTLGAVYSPPRKRRRLQMVNDGSDCDNVTSFYCWMSCLEIPDAEQAKDHLDDGDALYCLNPSMVDTGSSVVRAISVCEEAGVPGAAMNDACMGRWTKEVPGIPHQKILQQESVQGVPWDEGTTTTPYCYGATVRNINNSCGTDIEPCHDSLFSFLTCLTSNFSRCTCGAFSGGVQHVSCTSFPLGFSHLKPNL